LYQALAGEPTMIAGLVRLSVLEVLKRSIDGGVAARLWRVEDLLQIEGLLGEIDLASDARRAFSSERGFINDASETLGDCRSGSRLSLH
jgi:hypothetical protein